MMLSQELWFYYIVKDENDENRVVKLSLMCILRGLAIKYGSGRVFMFR